MTVLKYRVGDGLAVGRPCRCACVASIMRQLDGIAAIQQTKVNLAIVYRRACRIGNHGPVRRDRRISFYQWGGDKRQMRLGDDPFRFAAREKIESHGKDCYQPDSYEDEA